MFSQSVIIQRDTKRLIPQRRPGTLQVLRIFKRIERNKFTIARNLESRKKGWLNSVHSSLKPYPLWVSLYPDSVHRIRIRIRQVQIGFLDPDSQKFTDPRFQIKEKTFNQNLLLSKLKCQLLTNEILLKTSSSLNCP